MNWNNIACSSLLLLIHAMELRAQDPQFSQFYANSLFLNPAFAGNTVQTRTSLDYRKQWAAIPGAFTSYAAGFDYNLERINSGVGLQLVRDKAGSGGLRFTQISGMYAYRIRLNRLLVLQPGIVFGYSFRNLDFANLVFSDQLIRGGGVTTSEQPFSGTNYPDVGAGMLFYSVDYWVGASVKHINRPNQSLTGMVTRLPMKFSLHGGYKIPLKKTIKKKNKTDLTIAAQYKAQQKWDQLDVGAYYGHYPLVFGFWYRGIPLLKAYKAGYPNNDAAILLVGFQRSTFRVGYSYDITISHLWGNTAGSHEISLVYEWADPNRSRRHGSRHFIVPCAKF